MSSSLVTTSIPSGPIARENWCLYPIFQGDEGAACARDHEGAVESDYQSLCCRGGIVDAKVDFGNLTDEDAAAGIRIDDLVCCGIYAPLPYEPELWTVPARTRCVDGAPTPLASFAATGIADLPGPGPFPVTYTGVTDSPATASVVVGDYPPYCFFVNTRAHTDATAVTVPAVGAAMTDSGTPVATAAATTTTASPSTSSSVGAPVETPSSAPSSTRTTLREACIYVSLGLLALAMSWG
ncbi:hypothetical protein F4778DRAFT_782277 [Xylariomycetidae sp. FL2044]|nr:hypothetical protein F4778DRAFT_782277 [Xylariomycetidae sp. FL2044]